MSNHKRIFFVQEVGQDEFETESLWCIKDGDNYIVDNIPFIAKRLSLGDTIRAEFDVDDKEFYFDDFVSVSGNSTVRLFFEDVEHIESVRKELKDLGCESEVLLQKKIVAVNIPREVNYGPIKAFLEKGEERGEWSYEESCLAHEH